MHVLVLSRASTLESSVAGRHASSIRAFNKQVRLLELEMVSGQLILSDVSLCACYANCMLSGANAQFWYLCLGVGELVSSHDQTRRERGSKRRPALSRLVKPLLSRGWSTVAS